MSRFALGCYTDRPRKDEPGEGIALLSLDEERGVLTREFLYDKVKNPSYLWYGKNPSLLLAATENGRDEGCVTCFSLEDGALRERSLIEGPGRSNCHVNALPEKGIVFAASYGEGRIKGYGLAGDRFTGVLLDHTYPGKGPNHKRQEHGHAHQAVFSPDGRHLYVPDLGTDSVWVHDLADLSRKPARTEIPPGYGPRHMVFHRGLAYVLCELIPRLLVFERNGETGALTPVQDIPTVEDLVSSPAQPAAVKVHPSGKTLVTSNRFADTVALFDIEDTGRVSRADLFPSRGKTCRDLEFSPSGKWLLMAHQDSGEIVLRRFDADSGKPLEEWGETMAAGLPTCLVALD